MSADGNGGGTGGGSPGATPLAIVGMGAMFPRAEGLEGYWTLVREGLDGITEVPESHWKTEDYYDGDPKSPDRTYARRGGFLPPVRFAPMEYGVAPSVLEATDSAQLLGLVTARRALEDAGYGDGGRPFDRDRASVLLGVTGTLQLVIPLGARLGHPIWRRALAGAGVDPAVAEEVVRRIAEGYVPWKEDSFPGLLGNVVAGRIANRLDLHGTNCVVDAACASSLGALHLAMLELASGRSDLVLTGGVDTFNDVFMYLCFSKTPALSPTGDARPFDASADGTVLGEGIGMMVLKRLADAERDGDRIYAVVRGVGASSDGKGDAVYAPTAAGQARALRAAYAAAGVSPATVELVEAHGTGTKVGDGVEVRALAEVFREARPEGTWCALGSVKSQIGHTKAAAGAAGLLKAALALHRKVLPPTIKVERPLEALAGGTTPFYLNAVRRPWLPPEGHPRRAAVSSFGFGGSNFHCVLEEHGRLRDAPDWDGDAVVLPFAAESREGLLEALARWPADLPWEAFRHRAAAERASFDPGRRCRLVLVAERGRTDLGKALAGARSMLERHRSRSHWSTPDGVHFGEGEAPGRLGVLFPGQGSQYVGMLRDLACRFPEMLSVLAEADGVFASGTGPSSDRRLSDLVYPPASFDEEAGAADEAALRATQVAQPAIGAVSLGALRVLEGFGVRADAVAGHSYGELMALCAAGRFDADALHRLSGLRGRLMADGSADQGAMLAVQAPLETVESILGADRLDLVVANRNAPNQAVVSGPTGEIDRAAAVFTSREIRTRRLPVAAAFHSPLVAHAREPMRAALRGVDFRAPRIPVFANGTAREYPGDPDEAREVLAGQLATPVEFVEIVRNMHAAGVRTFFEVGPGARLASLVGAILEGKPHEVLSLDASGGKRSGTFDLGNALARLAALGHAPDLGRWDPAPPAPPAPATGKAAFAVELTGANYRQQKGGSKAASRSTAASGEGGGVAPGPPVPPSAVDSKAAVALEAGVDPSPGLILALQRLHERTAEAHRLFLEGQDRVLRAMEALMGGQRVGGSTAASGSKAVPGPPEPDALPLPPPRREAAVDRGAAVDRPPPIASALLEAVSDKTGYPVEMLSLGMSLDADLGIDSIKRVEILSRLQERFPDAPPVRPDQLGKFRTLGEIAEHLGKVRSTTAARSTAAHGLTEALPRREAAVGSLSSVASALLEAVAEKTGYPVEMLSLGMSLDADLGIDSIKRVEILSRLQERFPDAPPVRPDQLGKFRTLGEIAEHLGKSGGRSTTVTRAEVAHGPPPPRPRLEADVDLPSSELRIRRHDAATDDEDPPVPEGSEVWVTDDGEEGLAPVVAAALEARGFRARVVPPGGPDGEAPPSLGGLVLLAPRRVGDGLAADAFAAVRRAAAALRRAGEEGGALLAGVSRMDGAFGLLRGGNPVSGGLAGLVKTAAREWPEVACRAVDLDGDWEDRAAASAALADALLRRGPPELGLAADGARVPELATAPAAPPSGAPPLLRAGDLVVVSGGARGVTAACALALARRYRPALLLLGRSPAPGEEPADLRGRESEAEVKRALLDRSGGRAAPREIEKGWREAVAAREIRRTLAALEGAGATILYRSADCRDREAVVRAVGEARALHGPVAGILHGAGVLADAWLEEKAPEQVDAVVGTKVEGLRALLAAAGDDPLRFLAVFSSSTARFGRAGQSDYAFANEVLNKAAGEEARRRPGCRVAAVGWGPWEGGMVTPVLAKVFAKEGVGLIPLDAGAAHLVRVLESPPGGAVETVVLGPVPAAAPPPPPEAPAGPMSTAFEREVDPDRYPFLRSHVLGGRPVLPVAFLVEWLAHGALHGNPGLAFHGVEELRVLKGVVFDGGRPRTLRVRAGRTAARGALRAVPVELRGSEGGKDHLHARAVVLLAPELPPAPAAAAPPRLLPFGRDAARIYGDLLFHGPEMEALEGVEGISPEGIVVRARPAPPPRRWIEQPLRGTWVADPLALDAAFQAMILWSLENRGAPCLPTGFASFLQFRRAFPREGTTVRVRVTSDREHAARADAEFLDAGGGLVARMEGYECVVDPSLREAFRDRQIDG